jgi:hypothetical protein
MALTLRGSALAYVNNSNSGVVTLPAGAAEGDTCVIITAHGFVPTLAGWQVLNAANGSNVNGATFQKLLDAADITAGTVTVSYSGTYYGTIACILFVGTVAGSKVIQVSRNSSGATSRVVTTTTGPLTGEYAIYYGHGRGNVTVTSASGSALETTSNANASAVLRGGALGADGAVSSTFNYSSAPTGDYNVVLVITEFGWARVGTFGLAVLASEATDAKTRVGTFGLAVLTSGNLDAKVRVGTVGIAVLCTVAVKPRKRQSLM